jgi:hypothetical protein
MLLYVKLWHVLSYDVMMYHFMQCVNNLCHVMSFRVMSCCHFMTFSVMQYYAILMLLHVKLCPVLSYDVMLYHFMLYGNNLCHVMSCHAMSCHAMSCHVMSCHVMSCHVMSCHVVPFYVMSPSQVGIECHCQPAN